MRSVLSDGLNSVVDSIDRGTMQASFADIWNVCECSLGGIQLDAVTEARERFRSHDRHPRFDLDD